MLKLKLQLNRIQLKKIIQYKWNIILSIAQCIVKNKFQLY